MKATSHNGRNPRFGGKHNDRDFDITNSRSIEIGHNNLYWNCYEGYYDEKHKSDHMTFDQVEKKFYEENYSEALEQQNQKHIKSRHKERIKSIDDIRFAKNTCPEESIYQLGSLKSGSVDPQKLFDCFRDLFSYMQQYSSNIKILDFAVHVDEKTPHIHARRVFDFQEDGITKIGQDKALQQLGFEISDPNQKKGRYNNRKKTFDEEIKKKWHEIARSHGLEIDDHVKTPSQKHKETLEFQIKQDQEQQLQLQKQIAADQKHIDQLHKGHNIQTKRTIKGEPIVQISKEDYNLMKNAHDLNETRFEKIQSQYREAVNEQAKLRRELSDLRSDNFIDAAKSDSKIHNLEQTIQEQSKMIKLLKLALSQNNIKIPELQKQIHQIDHGRAR